MMSDHYQSILNTIKSYCSDISKVHGSTLFKLSRDGYLYLRYSKPNKNDPSKYYFGLEVDTIKGMMNKEFSVIFVCGRNNDNFIINKDDILDIIDNVEYRGNQWKINIFNKVEQWTLKVTGKERINISQYKNRFDILFSRTLIREKIIFKERIKDKTNISHGDEQIIRLEDQIKKASSKSNEPKVFEKSIFEYFQYLGFSCELIAKAGTTDILIKEPFIAILEVKSKAKGKLDRINYSRLKQHKEKHNANYICVVCFDFSPACIRDAEIENISLWKVSTLLDLLKLNEDYPLCPTELEILFKEKGILNSNSLEQLKFRVNIKGIIQSTTHIIKSIGQEKRTIDELYGRYHFMCERENEKAVDKDTFNTLLNFLSISQFKIVKKDQLDYNLTIKEEIAFKRLNKLWSILENE